MNLTLTEPQKFEDAERWVVRIVEADGLLSGKVGIGNTPEEATEKAQTFIDDVVELEAEFACKKQLEKKLLEIYDVAIFF